MEYSLSFGEWFREYREKLNLQRAELAARLNCAPITLRKIESDERRPSRQMAEQLAEQLAIPLEMRDIFIRVARGELPVEHLQRIRPTTASNSNLPNPANPLTGRGRELDQIKSTLSRREVRLLTLTGAPGVGKTRLALEAAHSLAGAFPDGVYFVPLAPLNDPALVLITIAHTLQIGTIGTEQVRESLTRYLRSQRMLLVLDNFEHVLEAVPQLSQLLGATTQLKLLVTSRNALEIAGEHRLTLLPLGVPPAAENSQFTTVTPANYPAVELFIQRARAVKPGLTLTETNLRTIGQICQRVDGLPLAIEFVAARCAFFTPQELLSQLDDRFTLLASRSLELPVRHLTLVHALDWSCSLLSPEAQKLFRRLAIFAGSYTLAMVQEICNSDKALGQDVIAGLTALISNSLLEHEEDDEGNSRFRILQTVRQYALKQLSESGELEMVRRQHADYFLKLARAAEQAWDGPEEWDWLKRLMVVRDDLRAVLRWSLDTQNRALALRLNAALFSFWNTCSILSEARAWIEAALTLPRLNEAPEAELIAVEAKVLSEAGYMAMALSDYAGAFSYYERGLTLYRKIADNRGIAWSIRNLALIHSARAEYAKAGELLNESLKMCEGSEDEWGLAWTLYAIASLELARAELDQARNLLERALVHFRQQRMKFGIYRALLALGYTFFEQGNLAGAEGYFREALVLNRETPLLTMMTTVLEGLGMVAAAKDQPYRAARLWGAVEALREMTGEHRWPVFQRSYEQVLKTARAQGEVSEWKVAWSSGRGLSVAQILAEELDLTTSTSGELD